MSRRIQNSDQVIDNQTGILSGLDVDTIAFQAGNTIRYTFNGTPNLSSVVAGQHELLILSAGVVVNDGLFEITNVNDGADYVDVTNLARSNGTDDEVSDSSAEGVIGESITDWTADRRARVLFFDETENPLPTGVDIKVGQNLAIEIDRYDTVRSGYQFDNQGSGDYAPIRYFVPVGASLLIVEEFEDE